MGKLLVTVLGCRDLEEKDTFGSSDPYVKLGCGGQSFKTKVIKDNINPNFNEQFTFLVADPDSEQLNFQVIDHNDALSNDIIGGCAVSLQGLERGVKKEQWFILQAPAQKGSLGIVLLAEDFGVASGAPTRGAVFSSHGSGAVQTVS